MPRSLLVDSLWHRVCAGAKRTESSTRYRCPKHTAILSRVLEYALAFRLLLPASYRFLVIHAEVLYVQGLKMLGSVRGSHGFMAAMILLAIAGFSGCKPSEVKIDGTPADAPESTEEVATELRLSGSSTIAPLMLEIAGRFEKQHPGVTVDVQTGGSGKGIADVRTGIAEIGMASRALKGDEQDLAATTIALDGVGMIVHKSNPVAEWSRQQIIDIYQDRIRNWNELGGPIFRSSWSIKRKDVQRSKCFWSISRSPIRRFKRM